MWRAAPIPASPSWGLRPRRWRRSCRPTSTATARAASTPTRKTANWSRSEAPGPGQLSQRPVMQFDDVILGRRSIRGYKPDPVPKALIEEIIALAMRAPSSMNTQPWNFYVITGEPLDRIRAGNTERNLAGVPQSREFRIGTRGFEGKHRERQIGVAKQLFGAMGIARDDKEGRQDWVLRGFRQFDAPVCVIVTFDKALEGSDDAPFD